MFKFLEFVFSNSSSMFGFIILVGVFLNGIANIIKACRRPIVHKSTSSLNWNEGFELKEDKDDDESYFEDLSDEKM